MDEEAIKERAEEVIAGMYFVMQLVHEEGYQDAQWYKDWRESLKTGKE